MKMRLLAAVVVVLGVGVAACGEGDDGGGDASGGSSTAKAQAGGVVRLGYDLTAANRGGFSWDPAKATNPNGERALMHWVYGGLMRPDADGNLVPDLAERATAVDPNTLEVVLRSGLKLADGRLLDANMVKEGVQRHLSQPGLRAFGSEFYKLTTIEIINPTTLRFTIPDGTAAGWGATSFSVGRS